MTDTTKTTTTPKAKKPRTVKNAGQRAVERLDAARARLRRANDASQKADTAARDAAKAKTSADAEVKAAEAAVEYESRHPDLPIHGFKADAS